MVRYHRAIAGIGIIRVVLLQPISHLAPVVAMFCTDLANIANDTAQQVTLHIFSSDIQELINVAF